MKGTMLTHLVQGNGRTSPQLGRTMSTPNNPANQVLLNNMLIQKGLTQGCFLSRVLVGCNRLLVGDCENEGVFFNCALEM